MLALSLEVARNVTGLPVALCGSPTGREARFCTDRGRPTTPMKSQAGLSPSVLCVLGGSELLGERSETLVAPPVRRPQRQSFFRRWRFVIGGLVVALAIGVLIYQGIASTGMYYLTVSEYKAMPATTGAREQVRLGGKVREGSVQWHSSSMTLRFDLEDEQGQTLPVLYKGVLPDAFKPGVEVVLEGSQVGGGVFEARTLLTKCASKYVPLGG